MSELKDRIKNDTDMSNTDVNVQITFIAVI